MNDPSFVEIEYEQSSDDKIFKQNVDFVELEVEIGSEYVASQSSEYVESDQEEINDLISDCDSDLD